MNTIGMIAHRAMWSLLGLTLMIPSPVRAHCDGIDGPVVKAAQKALESGNVNPVLIWVQQGDEQEIRRVFQHALEVRHLGSEAKALADRFFFETLVRIHRAGEGAPHTGLKPAGRDLGPAIPLADQALQSKDAEPLITLIANETRKGLSERFEHAVHAQDFPVDDIAAGRKYVQAYVSFLHYAEGVYKAAHTQASHGAEEPAHAEEHHK